MKLIEWQDSYSVGINIIDEQHKKLFAWINDLYTAIDAKKDEEALDNILGHLLDYVKFHFSTEEKYFEEFDYFNKAEHKDEHREYTEKINNFIEERRNNKSFLSFEVLDFLEDWIISHVLVSDKKYVKCFHDHGLN